jgi:hypothetical protein
LHHKTWEEDDVGRKSGSSGLLRLEANQARVSPFASKLADERLWMVHTTSSRRSHEDKAEDGWVDVIGCIRLFYPYFAVFIVLSHRDILIF